MNDTIDIKSRYRVSDEIIAKELEDQLIIVPLSSGIGDLDAEMYTLNRTGSILWKELDGERPLDTIITDLARRFSEPEEKIRKDVLELIHDLLEKQLILKK